MTELLQDFQTLPYADEIMVGVGALLALVAIVRIVQKSVSLLIWVLLAVIGFAAVAHGAGRAPWEGLGRSEAALTEALTSGRELSSGLLKRLCGPSVEANESR